MNSYRVLSHEVRWFFEGFDDNFRLVESWFFNNYPYKAEYGPLAWPDKGKEHTYLLIPNTEDMGIKWRDEGDKVEFQMKGCLAVIGAQQFTEDISGVIERWYKWSCKGEETKGLFGSIFFGSSNDENQKSIKIIKKRVQRKIRFDIFGKEMEVPTSGEKSYIDRGASIELTRIELDKQARREYWTLGVEAFPDDSELYEAFNRMINSFFKGFPIQLRKENSMSYPRWLCSLRD